MSNLILTIRERARYRGRSGHLSWIAHRVSGLAILSFLLIHVWDTANANFYPELYKWSIAVFKHPLFALGEVGLMAAVLYHAFNGIRISILDFKPELWKHQAKSATIVWVLFLIIFIPIGRYMLSGLFQYCGELRIQGSMCWTVPSLSSYRHY